MEHEWSRGLGLIPRFGSGSLPMLLRRAPKLLRFDQPQSLVLGLFLQGVARSTLMTVLILTLVELPEIGERYAGVASGIFFSAAEIGGVLGPLLMGILYIPGQGFGDGLWLLTAITLCFIVGAQILIGRLRAST
ncbi:MAG TPA: hypothetical protein DER02_01120 [Gammaproteobacteria bacterium]|nr:hypothetical protein [Gammaproteobacteria bacterium]